MIEKPKAIPDWRSTTALVLSCFSLLLSCLVIYFGEIDLLPVQSRPEIASAGQVEAVAHVTLPPGTVLLSATYSHGLDTYLSAEFRMPRTELDAFLASGRFTSKLVPGLRAVTAEHNVGGGNLWDPESAKTFSGIDEQLETGDGTLRSVLIDFDDPDTVTVYLYATYG
jgi:hypothetical protein